MIDTDKIVIISEKDVPEIKSEIFETVKGNSKIVLMYSDDKDIDGYPEKIFTGIRDFDGRSSIATISKFIYRAMKNHLFVAIATQGVSYWLDGVPTTKYVKYNDFRDLQKEV